MRRSATSPCADRVSERYPLGLGDVRECERPPATAAVPSSPEHRARTRWDRTFPIRRIADMQETAETCRIAYHRATRGVGLPARRLPASRLIEVCFTAARKH